MLFLNYLDILATQTSLVFTIPTPSPFPLFLLSYFSSLYSAHETDTPVHLYANSFHWNFESRQASKQARDQTALQEAAPNFIFLVIFNLNSYFLSSSHFGSQIRNHPCGFVSSPSLTHSASLCPIQDYTYQFPSCYCYNYISLER